jgi:ribosomal protein L32
MKLTDKQKEETTMKKCSYCGKKNVANSEKICPRCFAAFENSDSIKPVITEEKPRPANNKPVKTEEVTKEE